MCDREFVLIFVFVIFGDCWVYVCVGGGRVFVFVYLVLYILEGKIGIGGWLNKYVINS